MSDIGVVVLASELDGVQLQIGRGKRDCIAAMSTQQVMAMLRIGAQTVENLAVLGALGLGDALLGQGVQDAVDGGQRDSSCSLPADLEIDLLGAAEIIAAAQHGDDSLAFCGASASPSRGWRRRRLRSFTVFPVTLAGPVRRHSGHGIVLVAGGRRGTVHNWGASYPGIWK